jgi:signal transduction histidine kinase
MKENRGRRLLRFDLGTFVVSVAVIWTAVIGASLAWNVSQTRRNTEAEALVQARVAYQKDIAYRRWNTMHGGVYARITESTPPNPYLAVPEREVETVSGVRLTLINPAYMTRQANELMEKEQGVRGNITSLNPLRPENAADEWEREALGAFENGADEVYALARINGGEYMRLMKPLRTEEGCLRCHIQQGYRVGDVRGGLSVAVSMDPLRVIERNNVGTLRLAHALLWALGLLGHFFGSRVLFQADRERMEAEADTRRYAEKLEESSQLKDLFIDIMRHDLLNPAGVIKCYATYLLDEETDPRKREYAARIDAVNTKLMMMIENASKYSRLEETKEIECTSQDLGRIVREAVADISCVTAGEGLQVFFADDRECQATVNPMIADVFANLASNADKYAAEGGRLDIAIEDEGTAWRVSFMDRGPGISDEDKERIFTRFERLNKEGVKGTGLGLAISRRIVDLHGGRIWVEDNPGGGSVFHVSLPKEGPPAAEPDPDA